jgi:ABC-type Na+ transport system ATPase subunit NatA
MKLLRFKIENFKGIKKTTIGLADRPPGNVITLIGLNESGKTTILEALSYFLSEDESTASLVRTVQARQSAAELVHKSEIGIFTGKIVIEAFIELDDDDVQSIVSRLRFGVNFEIDPTSIPRKQTVERRFTFANGDLTEDRTYWSVTAAGRKRTGTKRYSVSATENRPVWLAMVAVIRERLPKLVYFPTFLFEFPDRIYLREPPSWAPESDEYIINAYYRQVIQDVADSLDRGISIDKQVVQRLEKIKEVDDNPFAFWSKVLAREEYNQVRSIVNMISAQMGNVIFGAWNKIFHKPSTNKRIQIEFSADPEFDNIPFLQIGVFDGHSTYSLSERSLGFRWFFSFLLFTQFRQSRAGHSGTVFLFDEPASNLHATAQMRLLDGFSNILSDNSYIIYSTHSHYMVNPLWLEKAYIIQNRAIDYEDDVNIVSSVHREVEVEAVPYRQFVNSNPSRISYFQPALDALRFNLGPMVPHSHAVIVEGKFDYHPMQYFASKFSKQKLPIFPVNGAGDAAPLLSLFRGWGIRYRIILDDDPQGRKEKHRYIKDFGVAEEDIRTLGEIHKSLQGKAFEGAYGADVISETKSRFGVTNPSKRDFCDLFAQLQMAGDYKIKLGETDKIGKKLVVDLEEFVGTGSAKGRKRGRRKP